VQVSAQAAAGPWHVTVQDGEPAQNHTVQTRTVQVRRGPGSEWLIDCDGITRTVQVTLQRDTVWLSDTTADLASRTTKWTRLEQRRGKGHGGADDCVRSPMTGRVVAVYVQAGDAVAAGQALCVVEAMKMEHVLKAPRTGTVARVSCVAGERVDGGAELVVMESAE
jgi:biotin carboxyl carrier protein